MQYAAVSRFGLTAVLSMLLVWVPIVVLHTSHIVPFGLPVRLLRPEVCGASLPGIAPLLVRVSAEGLFVDSKPIRPEELADLMTRELRIRPNWPVYVRGDHEVQIGQVTAVIDVIRGRDGEVVLLGPAESGEARLLVK